MIFFCYNRIKQYWKLKGETFHKLQWSGFGFAHMQMLAVWSWSDGWDFAASQSPR